MTEPDGRCRWGFDTPVVLRCQHDTRGDEALR